jgi:hypothetical protein
VLLTCLIAWSSKASSSVEDDSLNKVFDDHISQALIFKKRYERDRLDSITTIALELAQKLNSQKNLAYCYHLKSEGLSQSHPIEAIRYADQAYRYYLQADDHKMLSVILLTKGNCQSNIGQKNEAIATYKTAINHSLKTKNNQSEAEQNKRLIMRYSIGMTQLDLGDLINASDNLYKVYEAAVKLKKNNMVPAILQQLGNLSLYRKKYEDALKLFREGAEQARLFAPRALAVNFSGLSSTYHYLNQADSAILYAKRALTLNTRNKNSRGISVNLGNLAEFYFKSGEIDTAIIYNVQLLDLATSLGMTHREANARTGLCFCYLGKSDLKSAALYINPVLDQINDIQEYDRLADIYQCAAQLHAAQGHFQQAYHFQLLHQQFADSMINQESNENLDLLHTAYQTQQKIDLIQQLELKQKVDQLAYQQRLLFIAIFSILGLSILAGFLWSSRKRQLKLEKQKENIEQRLLRSQMNPHFIFNAIGSIQNYLFDASDQKTALVYLSHFSELMRQILENSRETYITLNSEIDALHNYLKLQLLRYNEEFQFEINMDPHIDPNELMVPPLILQPFVENAIEHGKIYMVEDGHVIINIKLNDDQLEVNIIDNGKGLNHQQNEIKTQMKSNSLGTQITRERLEYLSRMFNKRFNFHFLDHAKHGTQVHITLPKIQFS